MTCGNCVAFAPNLLGEAWVDWSRYKCMMCGHMVKGGEDACHLFAFDPMQFNVKKGNGGDENDKGSDEGAVRTSVDSSAQ